MSGSQETRLAPRILRGGCRQCRRILCLGFSHTDPALGR